MQIRRVAGALGAEIIGVDLRDPELDFDAVYRAFLEHQVIFFRGVHLTEEEQLALGRRFGTPSIYPVMRVLGATEPTMTVIKDGPNSPNSADPLAHRRHLARHAAQGRSAAHGAGGRIRAATRCGLRRPGPTRR